MNQQVPGLDHLLVVAGGFGERLGGIDKALCVVDDVRLIDRALSVPVPGRRVVVRPPGRDPVGAAPDGGFVEIVSEDPAGAGPAAGLAAGTATLTVPSISRDGGGSGTQRLEGHHLVAVLAADHLGPVDGVVSSLAAELVSHPRHGVAVAAPDGNAQWLTTVWRADSLIEAVAALGNPVDAPVRRLVALGAPLLVETLRTPSLDRCDDLLNTVGADQERLGFSGPEPQRSRICSHLAATCGWNSDDEIETDPESRPATVLRRPGRDGRLGHDDHPEPTRWVHVAPPGVPKPPWAAALLVTLDGSGHRSD